MPKAKSLSRKSSTDVIRDFDQVDFCEYNKENNKSNGLLFENINDDLLKVNDEFVQNIYK